LYLLYFKLHIFIIVVILLLLLLLLLLLFVINHRFLFPVTSYLEPVVHPHTQASNFRLWHPIQCAPDFLSLGVKRPAREAEHSPPSSAKVKECVDLYLHSPKTP